MLMKLSRQGIISCILIIFVVFVGASYSFYDLGEKAVMSTFFSSTWIEDNGRFTTYNVARAQEHVPFKIILPTYLPNKNNKQAIPRFSGKINPSRLEPITIEIIYPIQLLDIIFIYEQYRIQFAETIRRDDFEIVDINGKQVMKNKNNNVFYFESTDASIRVNSVNIPRDDVLRVVESMINQIK
jgi:hypothetical protein